jgi:hypothetical protein
VEAISDLQELLAGMRPTLNPGRYVFVTTSASSTIDPSLIVACIREPEGLSVVLAEQDAVRLGFDCSFVAAWITLTVVSDLNAVGLTAAFARALGEANISCNVVAGANHDHIFVPYALAQQAMDVLFNLQSAARGRCLARS